MINNPSPWKQFVKLCFNIIKRTTKGTEENIWKISIFVMVRQRHIKWLQVWLLFRSFAQNEEFFKSVQNTRAHFNIVLHACQKHFCKAQKVNKESGKLRFFASSFNLIRHTKSIGNAINASIQEKTQWIIDCMPITMYVWFKCKSVNFLVFWPEFCYILC